MKIKLLFLSLLLIHNFGFSTEKAENPNVVMIVLDDMNGYGTLNSYPVLKTPYLDRFRDQSLNFVTAACNTPVCGPSRASFFSGLAPHTTGAYYNRCTPFIRSKMLQQVETIPEWFKRNGYTTWGGGKIFHGPLQEGREAAMFDNEKVKHGGFGPFPEEQYWINGSKFAGIQPWTGPDTDFPDVTNANDAIEFLKQDHDKPFFMVYGLWRPHSPYTAPKRFFDQYEVEDMPIPEGMKSNDLDDITDMGEALLSHLPSHRQMGVPFETAVKTYLRAYCANTTFADWNVGRVIEALDASPYADNTLVIVFSDNGFHTGEKDHWGKATLWESADHVPLMIRSPEGHVATCKQTVTLLDLYPTLADYCKIAPPEHTLDGDSFAAIIKDPKAAWDRPGFTSYGPRYSSVRDERWRYLHYPDGSEELYDLDADPWEFQNLAVFAKYASVKQRLSSHIPKSWATSLGGGFEVSQGPKPVQLSSERPSSNMSSESNYLYVCFKPPGREGVWFAHSEDGYNWKALNSGNAWILPREGGETMRDPFIARGPDGVFHMVYTTGNYKIGHISSPDLVNWEDRNHIPLFEETPGVLNCWAPEIYYDSKREEWLIIWSSTIEGRFSETEGQVKNDKNHRIYGAWTKDFVAAREPFLFFDPGYPVIDASLYPDPQNDRVFMIFKDERDFPTRKLLKAAVGPTLTGPWTEISEPFTRSWAEGPSILPVDDAFLVYYDQYNRPQHMQVAQTKDFKTFKDVTDQTSFPEVSKHGGFISITAEEASRLLSYQKGSQN